MYSENNLTHRQAEILEFIIGFRRKEKISPTYREIAEHFGFKSIKAVADHLCALEKKGHIHRHGGKSRGIELLADLELFNSSSIQVPILGNIPAGDPEEINEASQGTISVDPMIVHGSAKHRLFALQIRGNSMVERGIYEGDWVIADADAEPRINDVVVALIDGENTIKTLAKQNNSYYLKAENSEYPDKLPVNELVIQGVAQTIIRRLL